MVLITRWPLTGAQLRHIGKRAATSILMITWTLRLVSYFSDKAMEDSPKSETVILHLRPRDWAGWPDRPLFTVPQRKSAHIEIDSTATVRRLPSGEIPLHDPCSND